VGEIIGIDLGTTYSAVARLGADGRPEILRNRDGDNIMPSVVLFQGDVPIVGKMAKHSAATAPDDVVQYVKRAMGDPTWRFETSEGAAFRPEEISALILKRLKEDAELVIGAPVTDAVITVPAYFDDARRRATIDAGKIAGLEVRRVLNEPTAAALAYGLNADVDGNVVVYDLGGGTFDVTVLRIADGVFDILATHGDRNLGGFDWDNALMTLVNQRFMAEGGPDVFDDDRGVADLREKAESAKHMLSTVEQTRIAISVGGVSKVIAVTRADFEEATSPLLSRTRDIAEMVLEDAGLTWPQVDHLLLVGGSTRMPMVRSAMEKLSGRTAERTVNPDEVVAMGAAVQSAIVRSEVAGGPVALAGSSGGVAKLPTINDVTSQGLGTVAVDPQTGRKVNAVIIPPNTRIPAKFGQEFSTMHDGQTGIDVDVTQGDDTDLEYVSVITTQKVAIPAYPAGAKVRITYAYDIDQVVFIEVEDLTANTSLGRFEVTNIANMSAAELGRAIRKTESIEVA
jgi:molecular chaperone DnaK